MVHPVLPRVREGSGWVFLIRVLSRRRPASCMLTLAPCGGDDVITLEGL